MPRVSAALILLLAGGFLFVHLRGTEAENSGDLPFSGRTLELFVGSASKPAVEEVAALFEKQTGVQVHLHFGGSGKMLAEIKLSHRGDIYFPGSSDYMEIAKREGLVLPETERRVVYLVPAINVPRDNPQNIRSLEDLAKPGVRVGIARPDAACVGLYAVEVLDKSGLSSRIRPNIVTNTPSCAKTAMLVSIGSADAILGWRVFQNWDPGRITTIPLARSQVPRIGYIPIAVSRFSHDPELARAFVDFVCSPDGKAIFDKWNYLTSEEKARQFALPTTPVGGEWRLPEGWK